MSKWIMTLLGIGLLCACSSHPQPVGLSIDSEFQQILVGDGDIANQVKVDDIGTEPANDHVRGVVRIKSLTQDNIQMQYRFYWYDQNGIEVDANAKAWKQIILYGGDEVSLSEVSLSPKGENFRLQIK